MDLAALAADSRGSEHTLAKSAEGDMNFYELAKSIVSIPAELEKLSRESLAAERRIDGLTPPVCVRCYHLLRKPTILTTTSTGCYYDGPSLCASCKNAKAIDEAEAWRIECERITEETNDERGEYEADDVDSRYGR
jgi:hypothetical protein